MNYKKNKPKPTLFLFLFLCFSFYLLAQLRIEYLATRSETNSWQTLKTATTTVGLHGLSVLSAGMINLGTQLNRIKNKLNKDESVNTQAQEELSQIQATQDLTQMSETENASNHVLNSEEIHRNIFEQQTNSQDVLPVQTRTINQTNDTEKIQEPGISNKVHPENQELVAQAIPQEELSPLDASAFSHIDTLEDQLTSAQKYILREEATDYSDHTINVLSEEIKSLKSYAHYIETEYGNEDHKKTFHKKLLTLVNKSEQLLTAITEELTGIDQLFQPSTTVEQGIEHNKTILAQLRTQLS